MREAAAVSPGPRGISSQISALKSPRLALFFFSDSMAIVSQIFLTFRLPTIHALDCVLIAPIGIMASLESLAMSILPVSRSRHDPPASDMELSHVDHRPYRNSLSRPISARKVPDDNTHGNGVQHGDVRSDMPPPSTAVEALQKWNYPRSNRWRVFATLFAFILFGLNDSAYGV